MEMIKYLFRTAFLRRPPDDIGQMLLSWEFPEFVKYERTKVWYIVMGAVVGLMLIYAVATVNFLFALIVLILVFIGVFQHFRQPESITAKITEDGIVIGDKFYNYNELESFWLVYQPPAVKSLYFRLRSGKSMISVPLNEANPLTIRELLEKNLDEDLERETEFFEESMSRLIKL